MDSLDKSSLPANSLKSVHSVLCTPQEVLNLLISNYKKWCNIFFNVGFSDITRAYLKRTIPIGKKIKVKVINKTSYGYFSGITENGSLILDTSTGIVFITAGDVFLVGN